MKVFSFAFAVFFASLLYTLSSTQGREIVVTNEWQVIGENDTVPQGMHVRLDLTTGEKLVKLPEADNGQQRNNNKAISISNKDSDDNEKLSYDFEMMYRTFSNLPADEKERMGGIPELKADSVASLSPEAREIFEARMKKLWETRQEEIRAFEADFGADLPQLLKDRIARLREYLLDPVSHLAQMDLNEIRTEGAITHIVSVLEDLEFQVADIDMAKDFHTLGGWHLLVELLSLKEVPLTGLNMTLSQSDCEERFHLVQAHIAWVLGTSAKNTAEFNSWATETIMLPDGGTTTAIDTVLNRFSEFLGTSGEKKDSFAAGKMMYALGALLRGNRVAQVYFLKALGPQRLSILIKEADKRLSSRILTLAGDVVNEIDLKTVHKEQLAVGQAIIRGFQVFCEPVFSVASNSMEDTLSVLHTFAPFCPTWDRMQLKRTVHALSLTWKENPLSDSDLQRDRLEEVEKTITELSNDSYYSEL